MKPRARKYNIRREGASNVARATQATNQAKPEANAAPEASVVDQGDQSIDAIRKEGLTGRQLRMARRVAQKHGLAPVSDFDAVRLLREKGVDPFKRANMLELVAPEGGGGPAPANLPQTVETASGLPSTHLAPPDDGAGEIIRIQQDIARRRRRKLAMLFTRLAFFVFLPTLLVGYYYFALATPMYATFSTLKVESSATSASGGGGGFFAGTALDAGDSVVVQEFLSGRQAMLRLDREIGVRDHFSQDHIDSIQRLEPDASDAATYKAYKRHVKIGFDPTDGVIQMEVIAADPELAKRYAEALISYAEEKVDSISQRARDDQMVGSLENLDDAEAAVVEAQNRVIDLKELFSVISTDVEVQLLISRISALELQITEDEISLQELLANERPNRTKVASLERGIANRTEAAEKLRAKLTEGTSDGKSLARIQGELQIAESELATRVLMLQNSLATVEAARIEADRQSLYLETVNQPIAPDEPTYPRAFENTILAFLIFSAMYLMASLTASILREQVSS